MQVKIQKAKMHNRNILVQPLSKEETLGNGIVVEVGSKNRRDVVVGVIVKGGIFKNRPGRLVFYPKYASDPIIINGVNYEDISSKDIILSIKKEA